MASPNAVSLAASPVRFFLRCSHLPSLVSHRSLFRPPLDSPFCGIYRTNGEICRMDDILVCQRKMNYHPGANVRHQRDRNQHLLKANCDGTVVITREQCEVNPKNEWMFEQYAYRDFEHIYKLTFNVIPRRMSNTFKLISEE